MAGAYRRMLMAADKYAPLPLSLGDARADFISSPRLRADQVCARLPMETYLKSALISSHWRC